MMNQYYLYKNENKSSKKIYPFFVDVQSDLLDGLNSRVVIPLSLDKATDKTNAKNLCPIFDIEGKKYILLTHQMTSVPVSLLKKNSGSLEKYRYEIIGAIDILLTGI
jgi:toxin CcdB